MLVVNSQIEIPLSELTFSFSRSGGPGGQNVNKVNSKVTLHWPVSASSSIPEDVRTRFINRFRRRINNRGEVYIWSQRFRDRGRNVADCLAKLRSMVLEVVKPPATRKRTRPSKASKARRKREKRQLSAKKQLRKRLRIEED